jgi:hypothetical protein
VTAADVARIARQAYSCPAIEPLNVYVIRVVGGLAVNYTYIRGLL